MLGATILDHIVKWFEDPETPRWLRAGVALGASYILTVFWFF
jgi:hypothetical protein